MVFALQIIVYLTFCLLLHASAARNHSHTHSAESPIVAHFNASKVAANGSRLDTPGYMEEKFFNTTVVYMGIYDKPVVTNASVLLSNQSSNHSSNHAPVKTTNNSSSVNMVTYQPTVTHSSRTYNYTYLRFLRHQANKTFCNGTCADPPCSRPLQPLCPRPAIVTRFSFCWLSTRICSKLKWTS
jgi:hypothetical protein